MLKQIKMENQIKTVEQLQQEISKLRETELDYKGRVDNYESMIQTFQQFKNNVQKEYYSIRDEIRQNLVDIAKIQCPYKVNDRYLTTCITFNKTEFFQIKIERVDINIFNSNINTAKPHITFILKGKSQQTKKWKYIPTMTEDELKPLIIKQIVC